MNDGPGDSRPGEEDNLFHRLKAVCTTVLHAQVQQEIGRDDPDAAIASFRHVLDRVERFIALDETQDPLSLHRLAGAGGDLNVRLLAPSLRASNVRTVYAQHVLAAACCNATPTPRPEACEKFHA